MLYIILCFQLLGNHKKLVVPLLTEAFDERLLQEFVDADALALALDHGMAAHIPFVEVYRDKVAHLSETCRIEVARNGFTPMEASFVECFLYETKSATFAVAGGKDAVLAVDNGGYKITVGVVVDDALLLDNSDRLAAHLLFYHRKSLFELFYLIESYRSSCLALHTANSFAVGRVAAEILGKYRE